MENSFYKQGLFIVALAILLYGTLGYGLYLVIEMLLERFA